MEFLHLPLVLFLTIVAPIWIISHYVTRWRTAKILSAEDEKMLQELWELAPKLESRMNTLERILDDEAPNWRKQV
ncbi:MAG: envelope stress response membrane protein PspB [Hyphomicrobiales bacterium]|nr:envelope stress response membrane protein PspB [Hyphomicrobiales bacterium]